MSKTPRSRPTIVALIPARSGSRRVPHKNIRPLAGHPLIAYTIAAARASGVFADVVVSTDSRAYARLAEYYGARVPFLRARRFAGTVSPDIEWLEEALLHLRRRGRRYDAFSILRPTSPFRLPGTIQRAWRAFAADQQADSLRAVEKCSEHPGKMWVVRDDRMTPLMPFGTPELPWHSTPYQALPVVHAQNASLEMAWSRVVLEQHSISGQVVRPFFTEGYEGYDINNPLDWMLGEKLIAEGLAVLPDVDRAPWSGD